MATTMTNGTTTNNRAILVAAPGEAALREVPIPKLRDDYILVRVHAVALNPTDWKHVDFIPCTGAHLGCDYAGVVEEVGSKVTKPFKKGDRVCGFTHGGNASYHEDGCFGTIITAKGDLQIPIPDNLSFEEAATLPLGLITVGQTLYQSLELPLPTTSPSSSSSQTPILIYGGSSSTGALAIQFAALSGFKVITTCSPSNEAYVRSLGAAAVFDYNSPTCAADIRAFTNSNLHYALDCISTGSSPTICAESLAPSSSSEGKQEESTQLATLLPVPKSTISDINNTISIKSPLAYTVMGEAFKFGPRDLPAQSENFDFGVKWAEIVKGLLDQSKIKPHRFVVNEFGGKGLEGVMEGMKAMREGKVRGRKLVYTFF